MLSTPGTLKKEFPVLSNVTETDSISDHDESKLIVSNQVPRESSCKIIVELLAKTPLTVVGKEPPSLNPRSIDIRSNNAPLVAYMRNDGFPHSGQKMNEVLPKGASSTPVGSPVCVNV